MRRMLKRTQCRLAHSQHSLPSVNDMRKSTVSQTGNVVMVNVGEALVWHRLCGVRGRAERRQGVALLGEAAANPYVNDGNRSLEYQWGRRADPS